MESFYTINKETETELLIQKSRFLCRGFHIKDEKEALHYLQKIQKEHWNATHHCYSYQLGKNVQKASDDGEPQGTAGRPILNVITKNNVHFILIVITRYFGGIKLGSSGLIRAYSQGAADVIEKAGLVRYILHQKVILTFDYSNLSKVQYELRRTSCHIESIQYLEKVVGTIWIPIGTLTNFKSNIATWTNGNVAIALKEKDFKPEIEVE